MDSKDSSEYVDKVDTTYNADVSDASRRAERRLRNKIDLFVVPTVTLLYLFCFIDRSNIGNARLAGIESDLGLTGYGYNTVLSIFYISYILFEIPATLLCKVMGPGWFLPLTTLGFGAITVATAFVKNQAQMCAVRFVLGIFEAGVMPGCAYYLSRWYTRSELTFRLGLWMTMAPLSGAFGGLLVSGILKLDNFGSLHRWQMIFGIEGIMTMSLAAISFFTLTDRPETARWLTEEEKELAIGRVKAERLNQTVLLDKIDMAKLKRGFSNPVTLSTGLVFLLDNVVVLGISFFLPTIIRTIYPGRTTIQQQLLTVPPYVVGAACTVIITAVSWRTNSRQWLIAGTGPLVLIGYAMLVATMDVNVRYAAIFLTASSAYSLGAMSNAQVSANVLSDSTRSIAIGTNAIFGYVGGLISTWIYLPNDAPQYIIGNGINLACAACWTGIAIGTGLWMKYDNKKRGEREVESREEIAGLTQKEIQDLEWRHPGWRWKL